MTLSHAKLCDIGRDWLVKNKRCNPVFVEKGTSVADEIPDVMGWTRKGSILIECKTSRSDFLADQKKSHRQGAGMGTTRYYLCEEGVINIGDLPDGWGLLHAHRSLYRNECRQVHPPVERKDEDVNLRGELGFLRSRLLEVQRFGR